MRLRTALYLTVLLATPFTATVSRADDAPTETVHVTITPEFVNSLRNGLGSIAFPLVDYFAEDTDGPHPVMIIPAWQTQGRVCSRIGQVTHAIENASPDLFVANWLRFDHGVPFPSASLRNLQSASHALTTLCAGRWAPETRASLELQLNVLAEALKDLYDWSQTLSPSRVESDSRGPKQIDGAASSAAPTAPSRSAAPAN